MARLVDHRTFSVALSFVNALGSCRHSRRPSTGLSLYVDCGNISIISKLAQVGIAFPELRPSHSQAVPAVPAAPRFPAHPSQSQRLPGTQHPSLSRLFPAHLSVSQCVPVRPCGSLCRPGTGVPRPCSLQQAPRVASMLAGVDICMCSRTPAAHPGCLHSQ